MLVYWEDLCELFGQAVIDQASHGLQMINQLLMRLRLHQHASEITLIIDFVFLFF